jgi:hypothetical protein
MALDVNLVPWLDPPDDPQPPLVCIATTFFVFSLMTGAPDWPGWNKKVHSRIEKWMKYGKVSRKFMSINIESLVRKKYYESYHCVNTVAIVFRCDHIQAARVRLLG